MQVITSKDNSIIKEIKKLKEKKYRQLQKRYIVEGIKLIKEAIDERQEIESIVVCEECLKDGSLEEKVLYEIAKYNCIYVTEKVFNTITEVSNPQGILAVIKKSEEQRKIKWDEDIIVLLDGLQDPGNLGTILRTVDSVGLTQIVVSNRTADVYNPKVVRSTMGAIYRVKVIESEDIVGTIEEMKANEFELVVTSLGASDSVYDVKYNKKVIVIGNEANGVSDEVLKLADKKVKIPMLGKTESLNASVATGVILYEYVRQKLV